MLFMEYITHLELPQTDTDLSVSTKENKLNVMADL